MRVFAFGCSYTQYAWPTWADIIGAAHEYQNWAWSGAGNTFIANRLMHCHAQNTLTKDDVVLICWSTTNREDRSANYVWKLGGNIYNNGYYNEKWLSEHWDDNDGLNKSLMAMFYVNQLAKAIGFKLVQTTLSGFKYMIDEYTNCPIDTRMQPLVDMVKTQSTWLPGISEQTMDEHGRLLPRIHYVSGPLKHDHHPMPLDHLAWLNTHVPEFVNETGIALAEEYQAIATSLRDYKKINDTWLADSRNQVRFCDITGSKRG